MDLSLTSGDESVTVTFEFNANITRLISTVQLVYGEFLNASALTMTISGTDIPTGVGQHSVVVRDLPNLSTTNYLFKLRTSIGIITYDSIFYSEVASLYPTTPTTAPTTAPPGR